MFKEYLEQLVEKRQIPGAVLYISKNNETKFFQAYGSFTDKNNQRQIIHRETIFDVASLTKIMATLPSVLLLASRKEIDLDQSLQSFFPESKSRSITIHHLLQHTSGLPADLFFQDRMKSRDVLKEIFQTELVQIPGTVTLYSDLGMILLGKVVEKVTGEPLNHFTKEQIFKPWQLNDTTYLLSNEKKQLAASTEWYKNHYIQGDVHDEKAYQMNGVSGSAGVFSTAKDVATFASHWLYPEEQAVIPPSYLRSATIHQQNNRGLGFEVWSGSGEISSISHLWPIGTFGHTGFTGTSVWICPTEQLVVVLLTNAVHFGRNTMIRSIRKKLHELVYSAYMKESQQ